METSPWPQRPAIASGVAAPHSWRDALSGLTRYHRFQVCRLALLVVALVASASLLDEDSAAILMFPLLMLAFALPKALGLFAKQPPVGPGRGLAMRTTVLAGFSIIVDLVMATFIGELLLRLRFPPPRGGPVEQTLGDLGIAINGTFAFYALVGLTMTGAMGAVAAAIGERRLAESAAQLSKMTVGVIAALIGFALLQSSPYQQALGWVTPIPFFLFACFWHLSLARQLRNRLREHIASGGKCSETCTSQTCADQLSSSLVGSGA